MRVVLPQWHGLIATLIRSANHLKVVEHRPDVLIHVVAASLANSEGRVLNLGGWVGECLDGHIWEVNMQLGGLLLCDHMKVYLVTG